MVALVRQIEKTDGGKPQVCLRELTSNALKEVTRVHLASFPDSALTKLGFEPVRRYYEWQLLGPHDVTALGAFVEESLAGFCFGGIFRGATSGFLNKNRTYLAYRLLTHPWLIANPIVHDRMTTSIRLLRRFAKTKHATPVTEKAKPQTETMPRTKPFGILSIAVHPEHQGLGIGKLLMMQSEIIARQLGFDEMDLTVHTDNEQAIDFYERLGWEKTTQEGVWKGAMKKHLY